MECQISEILHWYIVFLCFFASIGLYIVLSFIESSIERFKKKKKEKI
jgi:hypothetical protein